MSYNIVSGISKNESRMNKPFLIITLLLSIISSASLFSGCTIHRLDIQQGNIIKDKMLDQLKIGNSQRQVRFVMGSPLLTDPFHANRWDYLYMEIPGDQREITEYRHISLYFTDGKLSKIVK